jgi:hypothetical protein
LSPRSTPPQTTAHLLGVGGAQHLLHADDRALALRALHGPREHLRGRPVLRRLRAIGIRERSGEVRIALHDLHAAGLAELVGGHADLLVTAVVVVADLRRAGRKRNEQRQHHTE